MSRALLIALVACLVAVGLVALSVRFFGVPMPWDLPGEVFLLVVPAGVVLAVIARAAKKRHPQKERR